MYLFHESDLSDRLDNHVRVAVLGSPGVGKSTLIHQLVHRTFRETYKETVEDSFICQGGRFLMEIIDTSGSFNFPEMTRLAIRRADVFLLVFSVCDWSTFNRVVSIRKQIEQIRGSDDETAIIVVGTKTDLENREISFALADATVCVEWGAVYHDVTCKDRDAICDVFNDVLKCFPSLFGERIDSVDHIAEVPKIEKQKRKRSLKQIRSSALSFLRALQRTNTCTG